MKIRKRGKYGVSMYSFSLSPNPKSDLKLAERLKSIEDASKREVVLFRLKVIEFHDKYGTQATIEAFGVPRSTIYHWKKLFRDSGGRLESLIPKSTAPKTKKEKMWHPEVVNFIVEMRKKHPRLGKEKLKPLFEAS